MNKTIEINGTWFVLNFMDKDTDAEYVKWHNFTMNNMLNANEFYIVQIVQEKDKEPVLQRKLRRVQKDVIEQIYRNPMSNNKRREIFYSVLDNPRCRAGKGKFFLWSEY